MQMRLKKNWGEFPHLKVLNSGANKIIFLYHFLLTIYRYHSQHIIKQVPIPKSVTTIFICFLLSPHPHTLS